MLEHIESDYHDLHEDLRLGQNSSWQQFTLAYCVSDNGAQYYYYGYTEQNTAAQPTGYSAAGPNRSAASG